MSNKAILDVEIDDSAFDEFRRKFNLYNDALKAMPAQWAASNTAISTGRTAFEKAAADLVKAGSSAGTLAKAVGDGGKIADVAAATWAGMATSGKLFSGHIVHATQHLSHWTKLTAIFSGLLGAGGLFGINRMAANVAGQRTSALGLGVSYGEQASFLTNFGRLGNAEGILQGFSEAETDVSKKYALRQYLGHTESGDPAKDFAEGLGRFKEFVDKTPQELLGPMLQARGYDKLGIGTEQARIVRGMSREEVAQLGRGYRGDLAGRLGLSDVDAKKWTEFSNQMERAGLEIENVFAKRAVGLTKPLEHLSESFINLTENLLKDGSPIAGWVKDFGKGITTFADELGSGTVQAKAAKIGRDIADVIRLFEAIVGKPHPNLAALTGIAVGTRFSGAARAAGAALARSGALGTLGAGAAAVGATAWGMNKLMPPHPERLRRGQEYENAGGSPTSPHPAQTEHRRRFGHPHINAGTAQTGAAAPGTPWNHELGAPVTAVGGGLPKAFIAHWTGGGGNIAGVEKTLRQRHLGVEYVMDREGHIVKTGGPGSQHIRNENIYGTLLGKRLGLTSANTVGMEIIADPTNPRHPLPYTEAQERAFVAFKRRFYPNTPVYGHGEIQASKQRTEGLAMAEAVRTDERARHSHKFGHPHGVGHHPATIGRAQKTLTIEDHTGGLVTVVPQ